MRDIGNGAIVLGNAINRDHPLNRGLVSHWFTHPGITGGRRWIDVAKSKKHGTFSDSGVTWSSVSVGNLMGSVKLDGVSTTRLSLPAAFSIGATKTVALWVQWNSAINDVLLGGSTSNYYPYIDSTTIYISDSISYSSFPTSHGMSSGAWYHVVIVGDNTTATAYVNGVSKGTATDRNPSISAIGNYAAGSSFAFGGYIADIRYYNRCLASSEVTQLRLESVSGYPTLLNRLSPLRTFYMSTVGTSPKSRPVFRQPTRFWVLRS